MLLCGESLGGNGSGNTAQLPRLPCAILGVAQVFCQLAAFAVRADLSLPARSAYASEPSEDDDHDLERMPSQPRAFPRNYRLLFS